MIDLPYHDDVASPSPSAARRFLLQEWPYLLMLALVLVGVGYTGFAESPIRTYWMVLAPIVGAICVASVWPSLIERQHRLRLIGTQALHWAGVLAAMELIYLSDATRMMTAEASALSVLAILALGTFSAGIHLPSWRIAVVGLLLGFAVPAIALLERSAMFLLLLAVVAAAVIAPVWWLFVRRPAAEPAPSDPILTPDPIFADRDPTAPRDPLADPRL
jgi:hypothetical protein